MLVSIIEGFERIAIKGMIEATPIVSIKANIKIKNNNSKTCFFSLALSKKRILIIVSFMKIQFW